jgi:hypothetical protein
MGCLAFEFQVKYKNQAKQRPWATLVCSAITDTHTWTGRQDSVT